MVWLKINFVDYFTSKYDPYLQELQWVGLVYIDLL